MKYTFYYLLFICLRSFPQNTLNYDDEKGPPKPTLQDVKWIVGN